MKIETMKDKDIKFLLDQYQASALQERYEVDTALLVLVRFGITPDRYSKLYEIMKAKEKDNGRDSG